MQIQGILIKSVSPGKICNLYCAGQIELQNDIPKHAKSSCKGIPVLGLDAFLIQSELMERIVRVLIIR